jgi:serine acetyltransferase
MTTLKDYFHAEIIGGKEKAFSWFKVFRRVRRSRLCHYLFWWRVANKLHAKKGFLKSISKFINNSLIRRHSIEIMLGAEIGEGLVIGHGLGIVITKNTKIGKNFVIRQNCTIGTDYKSKEPIVLGDNVNIGAGSCIIGSGINIGDRVKIGAMSFVNKNIPSDSVVYSSKDLVVRPC